MRQLVDSAPPASRTSGRWLRIASIPVVVVVVIAGVWVTGGLVTDDAATAKILTGGWLAAAGAGALLVGRLRRDLAVPVIATYVITAAAVGGYLLYTSEVDRVVDEQVVVVEEPAPAADPVDQADPEAEPPPAEGVPEALAEGAFSALSHETSGSATVIRLPDGSQILTLTDFATDPGPDLRVYLVPGRTPGIEDAVDLGPLKGNRGDQQYDVPADAPTGAVLIWCRAFSVGFGIAELD